MHQSVATIKSPEFINLEPLDINPLMSKCEIKVFYVGENRNRSYISKDVALKMAKTLRGAPIVGYYKEKDEDFADHGEQVIIDDEGIKFKCLTKPYGFVAPDAEVWFKEFDDLDDFGNTITREYLVTTGYLWTGQFPECQLAVEDEGRPHSMEIDEETLRGQWSTNSANGMEYYIINDAIFSKLCILGESTEPCFEGSSISASTQYSLDNEFKTTLFTMMQELTQVLEGGKQMEDTTKVIPEEAVVETEFEAAEETVEETVEEVVETVEEPAEVDFSKKEDEEDKKEEDSEEGSEDKESDEEDDDEKKKPSTKSELEEPVEEVVEEPAQEDFSEKYSLLLEEHEALKTSFASLEEEVQALRTFKAEIESKEKDELIQSFYMLDEEDIKDIVANKDKYTYDEIKKELSVIGFEKKVNFSKQVEDKNEQIESVTFNLEVEDVQLPDWVLAVKENEF